MEKVQAWGKISAIIQVSSSSCAPVVNNTAPTFFFWSHASIRKKKINTLYNRLYISKSAEAAVQFTE